jgi:ABC-type transport system substrate-binding protein
MLNLGREERKMKKLSLIAMVSMVGMLLLVLAPFVSAGIPPTDILYVGTIGWGPRRADPVRAYDTGSGELIFNSYDTLIEFDREKYWEFTPGLALNVPDRVEVTKHVVNATDVDLSDPSGSEWNDTSVCLGWVDYPPGNLSVPDILYMREADGKYRTWTVQSFSAGPPVSLTLWRGYYDFFIREKNIWGNDTIKFVDENGTVVGEFDIGDVEYSFERGLVQDQYGSPMWMFYKPLFDQMNSDFFDTGNPEDAKMLAHLIDDAFEIVSLSPPKFRINVGFAFPDIAFKQILSQTWASIVDKQFSLSIGCWDGNLYYDSTPSPTPKTGEELGYTWERVTNETVGKGDGTTTVFNLANAPVVPGSETIYIAGVPTTAYTINYTNGKITFTTAPANNTRISADYTYIISEFQTSWWPIQEDSETVYLNGNPTTNYTIEYATGAVTLTDGSDANYTVTIDYTYIGGFPDWFETNKPVTWWRHKSRSPYDTTGKYRYVGTGPYYISVWDSVNKIVILSRNPYYWKGWPAAGCKGYLETIEIRYIDSDDARISAFKACDLDVAAIPRARMSDLVEPDVPPGDPLYPPYTNYVDVPVKTIKNIPTLTLDALHFTFDINPISEYVGSGRFPNGIPLNFFSNVHVRKAWAYAFNWSNYIRDAYYGEGIYRKNPLIYGLAPDYYNSSIPSYFESLAKAEEELKAAVFPESGYANVWQSGFELTISYNTGNTQRQIACEMIATFFTTLSTYDNRSSTLPPFKVNVINLDWPVILDKFENFELPTWIIGWLADFADADNWVRPYMHSYGDFSFFQGYTVENSTPGPLTGYDKDILIDLAVRTPDGDERRLYYNDLQWIYYNDCPSIPLVQPTGRRWCKYYVRGWYYNALYPSQYYYHLWKENTCWFDISGLETPPAPGVSDGVCNARDVTYLIQHFNAKPPAPGFEDPKWVGTYGCGGVDPYGDRICNARDITWAILHFNHRQYP